MKTAILLTAALCSLAAAPADSAFRAFPSVIMIRGDGLTNTIVLHHTFKSGDESSFKADPIVVVYSQMAAAEKTAAVPALNRTYDVALFWGPQWVVKYGTDYRPIPNLSFAQGSQYGKLFVSADKIQWAAADALDLRPGEGRPRAVVLDAEAIKVLRDAGVPKN